jgi:hypothetical protein
MNQHISVLARRSRGRHLTWSFYLSGLMMSACGPQDPAFTEQSQEASSGDQITDASVYGDSAPARDPSNPADGTSGSQGGDRFGSWRPGDPSIDNPTNPGTEPYAGLALVSDVSTFQTNSKVDILWIVDSSGSMREEQTYLGQNFSSFVARLTQSNTDFRMGVTTTDVCDNQNPGSVPVGQRYCPTLDGQASSHLRGSLVGALGSKVLTPTTPDIQAKFLSYANVGINGSSFEHGLTAGKMAIQKSLSGQNEGLIRLDAFLAVIVVSDEEDDGIGLGMTDSYTGQNFVQAGLTSYRYTSDDFIQDTRSLKGAGNFSVSTITGTRNTDGRMCTSAHSQPLEEGTQYINAAKKTGGIIQSICETNWSASLASIGQDITAQSSQIVLTKAPYASSIKVFINGVQTTSWSYNSGNNAIRFDVGHLPTTGSQIKVQYYAAP